MVDVCRVGPQDNWLITQLINRTVNGTRLPRVSVLIGVENLDFTFDDPFSCQGNQTFSIHVYETSSVDSATARNITNYRQVERVSISDTYLPYIRVNETVNIDFNTNHSSFYLAVQHNIIHANSCAICFSVNRVIVFYTVCPVQTVDMISYPLTIAPVSGLITISASCVENAEPVGEPPVINCSPDGSWDPPSSVCRCMNGTVNMSGACIRKFHV